MGDLRPSSSIDGLLSPEENRWVWAWRSSSIAGDVVLGDDWVPPQVPPPPPPPTPLPPLAPPTTPIWCNLSWLEHCD